MARMQGNGDDGTAGGGEMVCKVDWRDEKEKAGDGVNLLGLMFAVLPRVTHPSDKLLAYFQPAHVTSSPLRVTPLCISLVFYLSSPFAISLFLLPPVLFLPLFCL